MIKVAVIDDHQLIREGIARLMNSQDDMELVGSFAEADKFLNTYQSGAVDILILDLSLTDCSGLDILKEIKGIDSKLSVLILSMHDEEQYAVRALKSGASGYITKGSASRNILKAVRKIYTDGIYISSKVSEKLARDLQHSGGLLPHEELSGREYQILLLFGRGFKTAEIAEKLFISDNTVRTYRSRIMKKMCLKSTAELIRYVLENDLL